MSWGTISTVSALAGYAVQYALGGSDSSSSAATPPSVDKFEPKLQRASLTTIIQLALFGFELEGSKLNFIDNALSFDPPGVNTSLRRTTKSMIESKSGASRDDLPELRKDFHKARELYALHAANAAQLKAIQTIFYYAIKGLEQLDKTYPDTLVTEFTDPSKRLFDEIIKMEFVESEALARSEVDNIQFELYRQSEIEVVANALNEGTRDLRLIHTMVEGKILHWQARVNDYLNDKFK